MTTEEAWNRGNNLLATSVVALAGIAFLPETIVETEWPFKADDILLFVLGVVSVIWYKTKNHRFIRSAVPVFFTVSALVIKLSGILMEFKDKEDVGDDFGGLLLFVAATILVLWLFYRSRASKK